MRLYILHRCKRFQVHGVAYEPWLATRLLGLSAPTPFGFGALIAADQLRLCHRVRQNQREGRKFQGPGCCSSGNIGHDPNLAPRGSSSIRVHSGDQEGCGSTSKRRMELSGSVIRALLLRSMRDLSRVMTLSSCLANAADIPGPRGDRLHISELLDAWRRSWECSVCEAMSQDNAASR